MDYIVSSIVFLPIPFQVLNFAFKNNVDQAQTTPVEQPLQFMANLDSQYKFTKKTQNSLSFKPKDYFIWP